MALNREVHPNVPTNDEEEVELTFKPWRYFVRPFFMTKNREEWRSFEERRKLEGKERKETAWRAMQSKPTVDQINEMNWSQIAHRWCGIGESLGISKGVMEETIRTVVLLPGIDCNGLCDIHTCCIKAMLIKWLRKDPGTGNSERIWITIAKAVKDVGLGDVAFELLEKVVKNYHSLFILLNGPPTLKVLKDTIVHRLGKEWRSVGDSLGLSPKVKEEIGNKFGSVPTQCSEAMFSKWLNHEEGTGDKERTWGTVLTALEDAGRGDVATAVLDELIVKHEEESLRAAPNIPNIDDIRVLVIPHVLLMWRTLGLRLGIHKAILSAIESDALKNRSILSKQAIEMFRLWLDGAEGTGDQDRSWSTILKALIKSGCSEASMEVLKHFDPTATPKDIGRALSQLSENTQLLSDDIATISSDPVPMTSTPAPTTSQVTAETSLVCPSFNGNVGQVSSHDCIDVDGEVEEDKGCCSKSLKSSSTHHLPQSNGDHSTWSESKRRHLEEGLDKKGKCLMASDLPGKLKRRKRKDRRCLFEKSGHSRKHPPDQPGFSGQKRSPTSGDLEESDLEVTASSELSEKENQSKLTKNKRNKKISYSNVPVEFVVRKITRKKLCGAVKKMLNGQRIRVLCDDWELINETCKDIILGLLEKRNNVEAADQLIDYFKETHTGEELLIFSDFLRDEAEDDGRNQQLLNLAKSIEEAVYSAFPENQ